MVHIATIGMIIDDIYILYYGTHIGDKFETYGETNFILSPLCPLPRPLQLRLLW